MIQDAGENHLKTYRQATVAEWVALWPIFDVCMKETGYGGGLRYPLWRKAEAEQ